MAIVKDKTRNKYYINYKWKTPDGTYKSENIKNKEWIIEGDNKVSIKYMRAIEQEEIAKDLEKKKYNYHVGSDMSLGSLIDLFYKVMLSQGIDKETIYAYSLSFKKYLFPIIEPHNPIDKAFTMTNVDNFRINLTSLGLANKTINNKLVAVRKLVELAKKRKLISREMADDAIDILTPVKNQNRRIQTDNFFHNGEDDFRKFVETFEEKDNEWKIPILTMFYGALRIGEWQAITKNDCNFNNCTILINKQIDPHGNVKMKTKTGEEKIIKFPSQFMEELKHYIDERKINPNQTIFVGAHGKHVGRHKIRDLITDHIKLAGLEHLTPHGLRHSFATRMFDKGYDVKEVQKHLGHASMETTMKYYIHYTEIKALKNHDDLL